MARKLTKIFHAYLHSVNRFNVCYSNESKVIREEEVREIGTISAKSNGIPPKGVDLVIYVVEKKFHA